MKRKLLIIASFLPFFVANAQDDGGGCFQLKAEFEIVDGEWEGIKEEKVYQFKTEEECSRKLSSLQGGGSNSEGSWWGRWVMKSSGGCTPCGLKSSGGYGGGGYGGSSSGNNPSSNSSGAGRSGLPPGAKDVIYDEYDPSIQYVYNEKTGMYEQVVPEQENEQAAAQRKQEEAALQKQLEEQRRLEEQIRTQQIVEGAVDGVFNAVDNYAADLKNLKQNRANVKDEVLPVIDDFQVDYEGPPADPVLEAAEDISAFSSYLEATSKAAIVMDDRTLEEVSGSALDIVRHVNTGSHLYQSITDPNNLNTRAQLYEDAVDYVTGAAGTAAGGYSQFSPPVGLWEGTYRASLNRARSLLEGDPSPEIDVWAPTLDYMGKITNTGSTGSALRDYRSEKHLPLKTLVNRHGFIEGAKRKILYQFFNDYSQNNP